MSFPGKSKAKQNPFLYILLGPAGAFGRNVTVMILDHNLFLWIQAHYSHPIRSSPRCRLFPSLAYIPPAKYQMGPLTTSFVVKCGSKFFSQISKGIPVSLSLTDNTTKRPDLMGGSSMNSPSKIFLFFKEREMAPPFNAGRR